MMSRTLHKYCALLTGQSLQVLANVRGTLSHDNSEATRIVSLQATQTSSRGLTHRDASQYDYQEMSYVYTMQNTSRMLTSAKTRVQNYL